MDVYASDGSSRLVINQDPSSEDSSEVEDDARNGPTVYSPPGSPANNSRGNAIPNDRTLARSTAPTYAAARSGASGKEPESAERRQAVVLHHQLIDASASGSVAKVKELTAARVAVDQRDQHGNTALHHAAMKGHFLVVAELIESGADVHIANHADYTALMLAAHKRHGGIVELLLDYRGSPNRLRADNASSSSGQEQETDLVPFLKRATIIGHLPEKDRIETLANAIGIKNVSVAARMIASGNLSVNEKDEHGLTLLASAAAKGDAPMIRLLLCGGATLEATDNARNTPLMQAVLNKNPEAIAALLKAGANTGAKNRDGDSVLMLAIDTDSPEVILSLAKNKPDLWLSSGSDPSFISIAASKGKTAAVKALLKINADVRDRHGALALADRAKDGDLVAVTSLLAAGADPLDRAGDGHTAFTLAAANGHIRVVDALLSHGASNPAWAQRLLRQADNHGRPALTLAVINNKIDMAKLLLGKKADPHKKDNAGRNALMWAAASADDSILGLLIGHYVSCTSVDTEGNTALIIAAGNNNRAAVDVLCRPANQTARCNINTPNNDGDTPLIIAARLGSDDMVTLLLKNDADPMQRNRLGRTASFEACANGHASVLGTLQAATRRMAPSPSIMDYAIKSITNFIPIARNFIPAPQPAQTDPVDISGNTMLHRASFNGQTAMVRSLLNAGSAVQGSTAIPSTGMAAGDSSALSSGNAVALVTGAAASHIEAVNKRGLTPLCMAVASGEYSTTELLLKAGANVNHIASDGTTPLWLASRLKERPAASSASSSASKPAPSIADIVALLLGGGAAIDAPSFNRQTPLIAAAAAGNTGIVRLLIGRGAAIDKVDINDATAVAHAACFGHHDAVAALLNAGAAVNPGDYKLGALTLAAERGHIDIVRLLIKRGANINHIDIDRGTALIAASKAGKLDVVQLLLEQGARMDRVDADHKDALYYAEASGNPALAEALRSGYPKPRDQ